MEQHKMVLCSHYLSFISQHQVPFFKSKLNRYSYSSGYAVDCGQSESLLIENNLPIKGH